MSAGQILQDNDQYQRSTVTCSVGSWRQQEAWASQSLSGTTCLQDKFAQGAVPKQGRHCLHCHKLHQSFKARHLPQNPNSSPVHTSSASRPAVAMVGCTTILTSAAYIWLSLPLGITSPVKLQDTPTDCLTRLMQHSCCCVLKVHILLPRLSNIARHVLNRCCGKAKCRPHSGPTPSELQS